MKYIVEVSYLKFTFTNGTTAFSFAELAKNTVEDGKDVEIKLVRDDEKSEEESCTA